MMPTLHHWAFQYIYFLDLFKFRNEDFCSNREMYEEPTEKLNILKCPMMQSGHHPDYSLASYEVRTEVIKMLLYPTSGLLPIFAFGGRTMFFPLIHPQ